MFHRLFKIILGIEGGYSDHPQDKGGKTKWGITARTAKAAKFNFETLTITDAEKIYFDVFYKANKVGFFAGTEIHAFAFDWIVNSGPRVIKLIQAELGVDDDGSIGPVTGKAASQRGALRKLQVCRLKDQMRICKDDPSQEAFLVGWARRSTNPIWEQTV